MEEVCQTMSYQGVNLLVVQVENQDLRFLTNFELDMKIEDHFIGSNHDVHSKMKLALGC